MSAVLSEERSFALRAMPGVFVLIWSTGFIVARYGMPHAPPFTFLCLRYALSVLAFGVWLRLAGAAWPQGRSQVLHLGVVGVLMQAGYLGGVWASVRHGIAAGTIALIVGLQPVLTALWVTLASRGRPDARAVGAAQWLGLLMGLAGLVLVVWRKLGVGEVNALNLLLAVGALLSITVGALYQQRHVKPCDPRTANLVQMAAALLVSLPVAALEPGGVDWTHPEFLGALAWSVLVVTLGGSSLLFMLLQRGAATRVTSLFYLVPPCTALLAWLLFGEQLTPTVLAGMALAAIGVWLALRE